MNSEIVSLQQELKKAEQERNTLKYELDKEDEAFPTKLSTITKKITDIHNKLRAAYNKQYSRNTSTLRMA